MILKFVLFDIQILFSVCRRQATDFVTTDRKKNVEDLKAGNVNHSDKKQSWL